MRRAAAFALFVVLGGARALHAQLPEIRGYYLNVPTWSDSTAFATGGFGDLNRLRLMTGIRHADFALDVAYEQLLGLTQRAGGNPVAVFGGVVPGGGEWLPLEWTIESSDHVSWRHRFDRVSLSWTPGRTARAVAGRQAISWATTLYLTPADPFVPFDPSDPFREYRAGVDAIRLQLFPGPLSDIDLVVRVAEYSIGRTVTALARGRTVWRSWELSGWLGVLHDEAALAVGATGALGGVAVRGEAELRESGDDLVFRGTVGLDGRAQAFDRDLYYVFEYQRDGFGAAGPEELTRVVASDAFARGELQVLGRDELMAQGSYQLHPLWTLTLLALTNLDDPSLLLTPGVSHSLTDELTASGGLFLGFGADTPTRDVPLPSEYGLVPAFVYLSVTVFF
ncbi:MAG: hypothetical protein GWN99_18205 [Gemmatimonadetes bacterium]|uniref:Uncharacterized protein n=1 Tax=Candidatus Kutchimonas denitrificans TaxID=3056748 RepID=A0AAE5CB28_9BACT|nr:hypothetical protein [Gemmatimonadota bacterium]NIR73980.1 hypothetical protein [Candidatus Kutchimonas denitrificans]NIS02969.1 hypothetical protein [Gemmatimonadota bacterium]NIT68686.1 hypothetical protein [Gemmatimonadota bacterium]NIU53267.1 hypothetical protein [Gemmatimonadota bacterium]